jgi:hypothetical protein
VGSHCGLKSTSPEKPKELLASTSNAENMEIVESNAIKQRKMSRSFTEVIPVEPARTTLLICTTLSPEAN